MNNKLVALVTGGAGFIGSNLCRILLSKEYRVVCMDNLFSGRKENIQSLLANPYFEFIQQDVTEPLNVKCNTIFNLACPASPVFYQKDSIQTLKTSILGAINVLELANKNNCVIFHASTSEVYGNPLQTPQIESYWGNVNQCGYRSCYDEGKRAAETLFLDYHRTHGTKIKIARIFNVYGPLMRSDDGRLVSNLINQALRNEDVTIYGNGEQTRSLCYIDDLLSGIFLLMETADEFTGPINIGNPDEKSVLEVARMIIALTNSNSNIVYKPLPSDDPKRRCPDITLAREKLNWEPKIDLRTGLLKTIDFYKGKVF